MSDIPHARELLKLALTRDNVYDTRLTITKAMEYMTREKYTRKASPRSRIITKEIREKIKRCAAENPDTPMQDIAVKFGVNAGRVSEILAGKK